MRVLVFTSSKGGVGKTMAATLVSQALARRGHRVGFADFSGIAPNASGRWGDEMFRLSGPPTTWLDAAPVSVWPVDPASGLRLLAGPASLSQRVGAQMVDCLRRVLVEAAAGLDVLVVDLDGVQNIELHRVALEAATAVVWVVDHSPETVSEVRLSLLELAKPAEQARNGLPLVMPDRCRFVMVDHKDRGRSTQAQTALRDLGAWCGTLRFSARLEALAAVGQLAGAIPRDVLADADRVASAVLPAPPPSPTAVVAPGGDVGKPDGLPLISADGVLRVFAGPSSPVPVSGDEFRVLVIASGAAVVAQDQAAAVLALRSRDFAALARGLLNRRALGDVRRGSVVGLQWPSDVAQMRAAAAELQGGPLDVARVRQLLLSVTGPAYGGQGGGWAFTTSWPSGVSLAQRAQDALRGLADQVAGHPHGGVLRGEVLGAVERARVGDARWLEGLRSRFADRESERPVFAAPTPAPPSPAVPLPPPALERALATAAVRVVEPGSGRVATQPPTVPVRVATVPVRVATGAAQRPRVMVRLFGQVDVQSWPVGEPLVTRGLAVPVVLAVTGRAMPQGELCALTGYSEATLKNTFPAGHPVVARDRGVLYLADGVMGEHEWLATLVRAAAEAVQAGRPGEAVAGVVEALGYAHSVSGRPFEVCPRSPERRGANRDVWAWVDEPLAGEWRTAREIAGRRWVEALVMGVRLWRELSGASVYPDALVVEVLCRAAWMTPLTAVPGVAVDGWTTAAHVLLLEARKVAGRSVELLGQVHAMAAELVGSADIDADDLLAEALGLPRS